MPEVGSYEPVQEESAEHEYDAATNDARDEDPVRHRSLQLQHAHDEEEQDQQAKCYKEGCMHACVTPCDECPVEREKNIIAVNLGYTFCSFFAAKKGSFRSSGRLNEVVHTQIDPAMDGKEGAVGEAGDFEQRSCMQEHVTDFDDQRGACKAEIATVEHTDRETRDHENVVDHKFETAFVASVLHHFHEIVHKVTVRKAGQEVG